jgi:hypothetical protein
MKKTMISQVFTQINQKESIASAYSKLTELNNHKDPYYKQKAAGALGGAVRHRFIILTDGKYTRVR